MRGNMKRISAWLVVFCLVLSVIGGSVYAAYRYFEDAKGHRAQEAIEALTEQGVINGYPDGLCYPDEIITRAEFATLLARTMTEDFRITENKGAFTDISGHWAEQNIRYLMGEKVILSEEYQDGIFAPNTAITHQEMIAWLLRALRCDCKSEECLGNLNTEKQPEDTVTRGEAFELLVEKEKEPHPQDKPPVVKPEEKPPTVKPEDKPSGGGGSTYVPAPRFEFKLPTTVYVGESIEIKPTQSYVKTVVWTATKDGVPVDIKDAFAGDLTATGGTITPKEDGSYTLTATAQNSRGRTTVVEQTVAVYDVVSLGLTLPKAAHTDTTIAVDVKSENLGESGIAWSLTKDGNPADLKTAITGELTAIGGTIQFKEKGVYELTATTKDGLDKAITESKKITVYPVAELTLTLPTVSHTDKTVDLITATSNADGLNITYFLTHNARAVKISDYIEGSLSEGSIRFKEKGVYQLTAAMQDKTGRAFATTANITVYPVGSAGFYLPTIFHTDDTVKVETTFAEIGTHQAVWELKKDNESVPLSDFIIGKLTNDGGNVQFKEKGAYILSVAFTDEGGRTYSYKQNITVYPVPTVTFAQPSRIHTDTEVQIRTTATDLDGLTLEWLVDNSFGYQDWNTFVNGTLTNNGGNIHFKRAGIYELVARATDETGRVFLYEPKNTTEVLPVLTLGFTLPQFAYPDTKIDIRTSGHNNTLPMKWTLTKDGQAVSVGSAITGELNTLGGDIYFKEHGEYVLTATMTDYLNRTFTHSDSIRVYPVFDFAFTMPSTIHYGTEFEVVASTFANMENVAVTWTLSKNGETAGYTGTLTKNGGTIAISEVGRFVLTATATDALGKTIHHEQSIEITNTAPTVTATAEPTRTVQDSKFLVNITATASDADGDETTLEWQGRTADDYYAVGTHTIQVRAKDIAGAYSPWVERTFTIANTAPTRPIITRTPNTNSVAPGTAVTITASSTDADGDAITYVWDGRPEETAVYPLGKQTVRVKAVDSTGAESPWAAVVFFVADSNGSGGMTLTGPNSTIMENGLEGATITRYTFTVPPVSGHSGADFGRVRGYNILTNQWEQLDYGTTINGITFERSIGSGLYSRLEFYYYTNHSCMYNKSNITYSVEYHFE